MKRTAHFLVLLAAVSMSLSLVATDEVYRVIEKSDTKALRNLCNSALFNISKEDKKAFAVAAHRKTDDLHLSMNNFALNDASRLALGIPSTIIGLPLALLGLSVRLAASAVERFADPDDAEDISKVLNYGSLPFLLVGGVFSYIGIDNIVKAITHHDGKARYDRALAIEAMIKRVKARQAN